MNEFNVIFIWKTSWPPFRKSTKNRKKPTTKTPLSLELLLSSMYEFTSSCNLDSEWTIQVLVFYETEIHLDVWPKLVPPLK